MRQPAVYRIASRRNGTLHAGATSALARRAHEHREGLAPGFILLCGCRMLGWDELLDTMPGAIAREKRIGGGSRGDKTAVNEATNLAWRDPDPNLARTAASSRAK